ncbi:MAG: hypothetical protein ABIJ21_05000 [Nanoarchaeota archaeon]
MSYFAAALEQLENLGIMDVLLPFLLIYVLIFAILQKINLFKKGPHSGIALALALGVVIPHVMGRYPECWDVVVIINNAIPKISILLVAILAFLMIVVFVNGSSFVAKGMGWALMAFIAYVTYVFLTSGGCNEFDPFAIPFLQYLLPIGLFVLLIWFITRDEGPSGGGGNPPLPRNMYP